MISAPRVAHRYPIIIGLTTRKSQLYYSGGLLGLLQLVPQAGSFSLVDFLYKKVSYSLLVGGGGGSKFRNVSKLRHRSVAISRLPHRCLFCLLSSGDNQVPFLNLGVKASNVKQVGLRLGVREGSEPRPLSPPVQPCHHLRASGGGKKIFSVCTVTPSHCPTNIGWQKDPDIG